MAPVARLTKNDVQKVIDRIRRRGWVQHTAGTKLGPACIIGHMVRVHGSKSKKKEILFNAVYTLVGCSPAIWNDEPGRTAGDVIRVLERVRNNCKI